MTTVPWPLQPNHWFELVEYVFRTPGEDIFGNPWCQSLIEQQTRQDPLKKHHFGQQRQRGRLHENPNVSDFIKNIHQALRVINGVCCDVKNNCRGSNSHGAYFAPSLVMPLEKRMCRPSRTHGILSFEFCHSPALSTFTPYTNLTHLAPHSFKQHATLIFKKINFLWSIIITLLF